jgi:hypothetical protein
MTEIVPSFSLTTQPESPPRAIGPGLSPTRTASTTSSDVGDDGHRVRGNDDWPGVPSTEQEERAHGRSQEEDTDACEESGAPPSGGGLGRG